MDNNELQHWGIKGQKWGLRRFQNKDGSLTPAGRKRYGEEEDEKSKKDGAKPKTEPKTETEVEAPKPKTKAEVLKSGSAKDLMEFRGEISAAEYQNVFKRFEDEKKLASYSEAETKSALDKFDDIMSKVDRVRVGSEKAINAYNTLAKINNAFNPSFRLPEIKEGKVNQYIEKEEKAREAVRLTKKLEKAEEAYKRGNKDALNNLTVDEMKSLNSRSQDKATVEGRFKGQMKGDKKDKDSKPKNASDSKPKGTVKEEAKPNKTIPATEKGFDGASYFKPKGTITEEDHPNKTIPATEKKSENTVDSKPKSPGKIIEDKNPNVTIPGKKGPGKIIEDKNPNATIPGKKGPGKITEDQNSARVIPAAKTEPKDLDTPSTAGPKSTVRLTALDDNTVNRAISKLENTRITTDTVSRDNLYSAVKLTSLIENSASKKVNKRTVSPEEQAKLNMKKASQTAAKTKSAVSAWMKAGKSVAEIASRLGISESTVRNYLEELK